MTDQRQVFWATAIVAGVGVLYGLYWLPVRQIEAMGLPGAWGTLAVTLAGTAFLIPLMLRRVGSLRRADPVALASVALGGAAFALYSIGFVYGHVAMIILLWFLTPVWSTLITRFLLGWPVTPLRMAAIVSGLAGLAIMLSAGGQVPVPRNVGEWIALLAGTIWAVATTGIRIRPEMPPITAGFTFSAGAALTSLLLAPLFAPLPGWSDLTAPALLIGLSIGTGGLWWGGAMAALMWAAARLDPARVGILLMAEVLIGSATAALWAGERLGPAELLGGTLVMAAAVLEVWPARQPGRQGR